eukprot:3343176-Rhodomonas_salina.1
MLLHHSYLEFGTDIGYAAMLSTCGPTLCYRTTLSAVLTKSMELRSMRYWPRVWHHAKCGTELGYAATRAQTARG